MTARANATDPRHQRGALLKRRGGSAVLAMLLLVFSWTAAPGGAQAPLAGGNGFRHFFSMDGYLDSVSGDCQTNNPNTQPGTTHTGIIIGDMSLRNSVLSATAHLGGFDTPSYTGRLNDDGTFSLTGSDVMQPSLTDLIKGKLASLEANGRRSVKLLSGSWTSWYTGTCQLHWTMTGGRVDFTCDEPACGLGAPGFGQRIAAKTTKPKLKTFLTLKAIPVTGNAPFHVTFTLGTKAPNGMMKWTLYFGDGQAARGTGLPASRSHTYARPGTYTATLEVLISNAGAVMRQSASARVTVAAATGSAGPHPPAPKPAGRAAAAGWPGTCGTNAGAVAHMVGACTGDWRAAKITIVMLRTLATPITAVNFKFTKAGVNNPLTLPSDVLVGLGVCNMAGAGTSCTTNVPHALCVGGQYSVWDVYLIDRNNIGQGDIGRFMIGGCP